MIEKTYEYLKGKVYWLATEEGDQARVRPFGSLAIHDGKLYISTQKGKKVYQQMLTNPKIELGAMGQGGGWIRVEAEAVEENDPDARKALWAANAARRKLDPEKVNENAAYFSLKNATVTINKTGGEQEIFNF